VVLIFPRVPANISPQVVVESRLVPRSPFLYKDRPPYTFRPGNGSNLGRDLVTPLTARDHTPPFSSCAGPNGASQTPPLTDDLDLPSRWQFSRPAPGFLECPAPYLSYLVSSPSVFKHCHRVPRVEVRCVASFRHFDCKLAFNSGLRHGNTVRASGFSRKTDLGNYRFLRDEKGDRCFSNPSLRQRR